MDAAIEAMHERTPEEFERIVAGLCEEMYKADCELTQKSHDDGLDIRVTQQLSNKTNVYLYQVKRTKQSVNYKVADQLAGKVQRDNATSGTVVSLRGFTNDAIEKSEKLDNVTLMNGEELYELLETWGCISLIFNVTKETN